MVFQLTEEIGFPDPRLGEESGIFAIGGDLSTERLLLAYQYGIFPWFDFRKKVPQWWCPMQRFVIFPDEIHISHSMRTLINKQKYQVTINEDFDGVIENCSSLRINEEGAWLGDDMKKAYKQLHEQGFAASVEVWEGERLVGGLYGVNIGKAFFGESMFSLVPSASKLALIHLAHHLEEKNYSFIDCQFETPHLLSMGGRHIPYDEYIAMLKAYAQKKE